MNFSCHTCGRSPCECELPRLVGQINFGAPICAGCGRTQTLATGIGYYCAVCPADWPWNAPGPIPPPLPKEWRGMFGGWKKDAQEYHAALKAIRGILDDMKTDEMDKLSAIEAIINGVFET